MSPLILPLSDLTVILDTGVATRGICSGQTIMIDCSSGTVTLE
jgi:hypothetical protein